MMRLKLLLYCVAALFLTGCATPAQVPLLPGGFTVTAMSKDVYQIATITKRTLTPPEFEEHMLQQCARLASEKGYSYFEIIRKSHYEEAGTVPAFTPGGQVLRHGYIRETVPDVVYVMRCGKGEAPTAALLVSDYV